MKVDVYAVLKDHFAAGFSVESPVESIGDLKQHLMKAKPGAASILQTCRFAVNNEFVQEDFKLKENDIIAVLPPASGG